MQKRDMDIEGGFLELCLKLGWDVQTDNHGQIVIYTGLQYKNPEVEKESELEIEPFNPDKEELEDF